MCVCVGVWVWAFISVVRAVVVGSSGVTSWLAVVMHPVTARLMLGMLRLYRVLRQTDFPFFRRRPTLTPPPSCFLHRISTLPPYPSRSVLQIESMQQAVMYMVGIKATEGALTTLYLATSPDVETGDIRGRYFAPLGQESSAWEEARSHSVDSGNGGEWEMANEEGEGGEGSKGGKLGKVGEGERLQRSLWDTTNGIIERVLGPNWQPPIPPLSVGVPVAAVQGGTSIELSATYTDPPTLSGKGEKDVEAGGGAVGGA